MRNAPSAAYSRKVPNGANLYRRLWYWFIAPSPQIEGEDQRRQAALLSAFLLALIATALIVQGLYVLPLGPNSASSYREVLITVGVLSIIYGVSRTAHVQLAAILAVIATSIALFITCHAHPEGVLGGLFDYLIVPLWLGSLYLGPRGLSVLVAMELIGLLIFPLLTPAVTLYDVLVGPFSFAFVASAFLILMTRHRNLLEGDRRAQLAEREKRSRQEAARAQALLRVAERLNAQLDLDTLLRGIGEEITRALDTPVSLVALYDPNLQAFHSAAAIGLPPDTAESMAPFPKALYDQVKQEFGSTFGLPDLQIFPRLPNLHTFKRLNLRSLAFATMEYEHEIIGSLTAVTQGESRNFTEDELLLLQGLADQAALAINNTSLYKDARRRLEHLQALSIIDMAIMSNRDLQETLSILLDQITKQLEVDAAVVLIMNEASQHLEYAAGQGFHTPTLRYTRLRLGEGIAGRAAQQRRIINVRDLRTDPQTLVYAPSLTREGFATYYAAPLVSRGQVKGVLELFHRSILDPDPEWLSFLEALAGQTAIAIESSTLFEDLRRKNDELSQAYDSTIEGWSHALDLRDKETEGHTRRVTELTLELAQAMGCSADELVQIRRGALLHDIGKMGVPDRILLKEGPLTEEEWLIMRQHPVYAHEMLRSIEYLRPALDIPYCHHEKWDGTGYPRGLKGEEIPLVARIFAIVDVWDALTSDRPYRAAWSPGKTLAHIQKASGHHFDPHVVEVFVNLINRH